MTSKSYSDQILLALDKHGALNAQQLATKISHDPKKTRDLIGYMKTNGKVEDSGMIGGERSFRLTGQGRDAVTRLQDAELGIAAPTRQATPADGAKSGAFSTPEASAGDIGPAPAPETVKRKASSAPRAKRSTFAPVPSPAAVSVAHGTAQVWTVMLTPQDEMRVVGPTGLSLLLPSQVTQSLRIALLSSQERCQ